jgi:hypothetical protein
MRAAAVNAHEGEMMGEILCSRREERSNKVIVEVLLHQNEFRQLRGEMTNIVLFSEEGVATPSKVSLRGRNEATQYFLVPRQLRKQMNPFGAVNCQRIETNGKQVFIYIVDPSKTRRQDAIITM